MNIVDYYQILTDLGIGALGIAFGGWMAWRSLRAQLHSLSSKVNHLDSIAEAVVSFDENRHVIPLTKEMILKYKEVCVPDSCPFHIELAELLSKSVEELQTFCRDSHVKREETQRLLQRMESTIAVNVEMNRKTIDDFVGLIKLFAAGSGTNKAGDS